MYYKLISTLLGRVGWPLTRWIEQIRMDIDKGNKNWLKMEEQQFHQDKLCEPHPGNWRTGHFKTVVAIFEQHAFK